jgi:hypothetical protein
MASSKQSKQAATRTRALALNIEGLLKLLGGTPDDRLRYWEILKGITTPAEFRLVNQQLELIQTLVNQVQASAKALKDTAAGIQRQG